ncbi:DnaD domain protein [Streptococcus suis]|uniref:DnaD and phage-associated domain protein n=1 Tax=Streptococcus suis TaxID=1307 RepID=A0A0Z8J4W5_STRSU|nr:replication initiator protein A [Streptococcus suis]NQH17939.1 DnaD domain protein [Streptococcus suis]CYV47368.1 dnaD and phage-associated domain protein [Streptococcus suis]HEM5038229.1 replication initiator protein A [Streptococcus suis]HEM5048928.1 replication initiator protein A [Streptococcus suis]HEM5194495.1 replication initiator protein A [Streptococcus suis]
MNNVPFFKKEVEKFQYFQMPKWLFAEPYCELSLQAKTVYMFLFNRMSLSLKNEWQDDDGQVFVYYSNEKLAGKEDGLGCSIPTVIKAKKELASVGLLKEVRQGLTLSNRIYLMGPNPFSQEVKNFKHRSKNSLIPDDKNLKTSKTEYSNDYDTDMTDLISAFQKAFRGHTPTPFQYDDLEKFHKEDGISIEIMIEAIKRTSNNDANFHYLQGILRNWAKKGIQTMEQVIADDLSFEQKKNGRSAIDPKPAQTNIPAWANEEVKNEQTAEGQARLADLYAELEAMENGET